MIFFYDFLRPPFHENSQHVKNSINIMELFQWQIEKVSSQKITLFATDCNTKKKFCAQEFYSLMNLSYQEENWSKIYDATPTEKAIKYISNFLNKDKIVLSHELPPIFVKIFNILKITFIDIRISSLKYLADLIIGFKTNNSHIFDAIMPYRVHDNQFYFEASLTKARNNIINNSSQLHPNSALFLAQTANDSSLIQNGKVLNLLDFKDEFSKKAQQFHTIYYKTHPYQNIEPHISEYIQQFPNVQLIDENIYKLLSSDAIVECFSISSGVLQEAKYFKKEIAYFFQPIYHFVSNNKQPFSDNKYISVYNQAFNPNFWSTVLGKIINTKKCDDIILPFQQSRLRFLHNVYWGYEDKNDEYFKELTLIYNHKIHELTTQTTKIEKKQIEYVKENELRHEKKINELQGQINELHTQIYEIKTKKRGIKRLISNVKKLFRSNK